MSSKRNAKSTRGARKPRKNASVEIPPELRPPSNSENVVEGSATSQRNSALSARAHQSKATEQAQAESLHSATSSAARKRRLELSAAAEKIKLRKKAIEQQLQLDLELVEQRLSASLAVIEEESRGGSIQTTQREELSRQSVQEWLDRTEQNELQDNRHEVGQPTESAVDSAPAINYLTKALTQAIDKIKVNTQQSVSSERLLSRLTTVKELPTFSGDALEWLRFKRAFDLSSDLGGYTENENVARLYNCLRGDAKEAVASLMITASNSKEIMETLELRFGNPATVVQKIVQELKQLPKIGVGHTSVVTLATKVRNGVAAMEAMNHLGYLHSPELATNIINKMPSAMIYHYNRYVASQSVEEPTLTSISKFLFAEAEMACKAGTAVLSQTTQNRQRTEGDRRVGAREPGPSNRRVEICSLIRQQSYRSSGNSKTQTECGFCKKSDHAVTACEKFAALPINKRWDWGKRVGVCFKCLVKHHRRNQCRAKPCQHRGCQRPHHALLHFDQRSKAVDGSRMTNNEPIASATASPVETVSNTVSQYDKKILLKVIPVFLVGPVRTMPTFALLDEGSTISLIDQETANTLGLSGPKDVLSLRGIRETITTDTSSIRVNLHISDRANNSMYAINNVRTVRGLVLPCQSLLSKDISDHTHLQHLEIECYSDARPMILIGQDNWDIIVSREIRYGHRNAPVASLTALGWVVHGFLPALLRASTQDLLLISTEHEKCRDTNSDLHDLVKYHFQLESLGVLCKDRKNILNHRAEEILREKSRRINNRWEVGLLWKADNIRLPENRNNALCRLRNLEKKMDKDPNFAKMYCEQIDHLIKCGYAEKIIETEGRHANIWYLPHFGVTHPNKPGKLRVVFDAAAKTNGISLNDELTSGPDMLNSLLGVLMRFRQKPIAFTADIKEMFLQIKIRIEDQQAQRFLWRGMDRHREAETYCMTSMIFGATSSPCTALYIKDRNAKEFGDKFPEAVTAITRKHYMDDYLDSVDTEEEAIKLIRDVITIHRHGGFEIRGWASNSRTVLDQTSRKTQQKEEIDLNLDEYAIARTLGLKWNSRTDSLQFPVQLSRIPTNSSNGIKRPTKREMLRVIMSIFDPLGLLSPFTVRGKILLQDVWRSNIDWDDELEDREFEVWQTWIEDLHHIKQYTIPRCYIIGNQHPIAIELHTFCDASEEAYSAVAYWRNLYNDGNVDVALIAGKCRVAPLKPQSIPRMELQAALLASRLARTICEEHDIEIRKRTFWSDSSTVLCWIRSDPRKYKAFVCHRLGEIDELTNGEEWRWVPSCENPADDATHNRRVHLSADGKWTSGPSFLRKEEKHWPQQSQHHVRSVDEANENRRIPSLIAHVSIAGSALPEIQRFSSWLRLVRSTAWILLFLDRCKRVLCSEYGLNSQYLDLAERLWIKRTQQEKFITEITELPSGEPIPADSRLRQLTPEIDPNGILRVGSRTKEAPNIEYNMKMPVILDGRHPYTRLLVDHYHRKAAHGSPETVINELRQKYWILNLRPTVKWITRQCQLCRVRNAKPLAPRMADLPAARLQHHCRPFTYIGLDYFGPMKITVGRHHEKRWIVLFTCLTTRAIHLEIAASLTTDSTIMALRRMMARRGQPAEIYSDNGTNLRGADAELRHAILELDKKSLQDYSASNRIKWHYIPPAAPHMGGSWERLIRSVKVALRITLKETVPREEVLATVITEAEHTVNSRPLTHVSVDHRDEEALTPNHFLIGTSSGSIVVTSPCNANICSKKQWRTAQRLADHFWNRWIKEYLPSLLARRKWHRDTQPLKLDDAQWSRMCI